MNKTHETPETLAAIIAEMRGNEFDDPHLDADGIIGARRLARDWADRIEAAAKRERAITDVMLAVKDKPLPHPDPEHAPPLYPAPAAAIRAVLKRLDEHLHEDDYDGHLFFDLFDYDPKEEIRTALSAPARNCDRFQTAEHAWNHYCDEVGQASDRSWKDLILFGKWLFAPAKGGAA